MSLKYCIDDFLIFRNVLFVRGWVLNEDFKIKLIINSIEFNIIYQSFDSPDVAKIHGEKHKNCRFEFNHTIGDLIVKEIKIIISKDDIILEIDPIQEMTTSDESFNLQNIFQEGLPDLIKGTVVEIGSRARSKITRKHFFKDFKKYIGLDIIEGDNVDVIGDAHNLSNIFTPNSIDCIFSVSVFEHLINPLRVVYEINKILKIGGYCQINTHQTWPIHDCPWDFFRFSKYAWYGLFNQTTGFEIVESVQGEPCFVAPMLTQADHQGLDYQRGYLSSKVVARKLAHKYVDIPYDESYMKNIYPY